MKEVKKKILAILKSRLNDIIPNNDTYPIYEKAITEMSDEELEHWIRALENGVQDIPNPKLPADTVCLLSPSFDDKNRLNTRRNLDVAKKWGYDFFERCWLTNSTTGQTFLTNKRYLTLILPVRRQSQTLDAKISIAESDTNVDDLTGQVTGESKGSSISYPEIQMLDAQGLKQTIHELIKIRGGDETAWRLAKNRLLTNGSFSQVEVDQLNTQAKANKTLATFLHGMHIKNNLAE